MADPVTIETVREQELTEIERRREKGDLSSEEVSKNLVGLCLSGGALRSASFSLGFVQALQRLGLWKFVDYLSTVSGGGYIGSYLTSSTLRDKKPISKEYQPLNQDDENPSPELPSRVQRFIYGGYYLMKPWQFASNYLMGVFFINLSIFSALIAVCALIAFLWRCLDYPEIRHVTTTMLGLGNDLAAPFWPFWVFGISWLIAWFVSLFRRGSDARGTVAKYLLALAFASLLIGCALLAGNGDIAGLNDYIAGDTQAIGGKVWGPIVAMVLGGLIPFLRPRRLLKSGMDPKKPWERYLFAIASTALLVGMPLVLIGTFARENISGFNDDPHRPLVRTDIGVEGWRVLCDLIAPDEDNGPSSSSESPQNREDDTELQKETDFEIDLEEATTSLRIAAFERLLGILNEDSLEGQEKLVNEAKESVFNAENPRATLLAVSVGELIDDADLEELLGKPDSSQDTVEDTDEARAPNSLAKLTPPFSDADADANGEVGRNDTAGDAEDTPFLSRVDLSKLDPRLLHALLSRIKDAGFSSGEDKELLSKIAATEPSEEQGSLSGPEAIARAWGLNESQIKLLRRTDLSRLPSSSVRELLPDANFIKCLSDQDAQRLFETLKPKLENRQEDVRDQLAKLWMKKKGYCRNPTDNLPNWDAYTKNWASYTKILQKPYLWRPQERLPRNQDDPNVREEQIAVDLFLAEYLRAATKLLRDQVLPEYQKARQELLDEGQWRRWRWGRYADRCFSMFRWPIQHEGRAHDYWEAKSEAEQTEAQVAAALNEILRSEQFLREQLNDKTIATQLATSESANPETTAGEHANRIAKLYADAQLTEVETWPTYKVAEFNRLLLEDRFPTVFRKRSDIRRLVTIYEDQVSRLKWFFGGLVVFLVLGMWVDLNSLSLHRYYRNRVSEAFIVPRNVKTPSIALSDMDTTEYGGPYHLITGSVGMIRKRLGWDDVHHALRDSDDQIDERWVDNFLFSRLYCGSELTKYVDTVAFEHSVPGYSHKIDLAEATAISGAALSPQHVKNWLLAFLMVAMNLNLGQYVPNPRAGRPRFRPRVLTILLSLWKKAEDRSYCFVSDGGHCDNLGLVQLLKRRCRLIIAVDASCDPHHDFYDLGRAIRMERVHAGISLVALEKDEHGEDQELCMDDLRLRESSETGVPHGYCKKHYLMARIKYPDADEGLLVYVKPSFDGDESPDLVEFRSESEDFPHDSTTDQLFDDAKVESYRALGYHIGMQLNNHLPPEIRIGELWDYAVKLDAQQLCDWFTQADSFRKAKRTQPVIDHPATASDEQLDKVRPLSKSLLRQMKATAKAPADIQSSQFARIVEHDEELKQVGMPMAVAAVQCAVLDAKQQSAVDREYFVWLLQSLELDENIATNLEESLEVLFRVIEEGQPYRVLLAAIATLAILGRPGRYRERVKKALEKHRNDAKSSIRLAAKNALSNFRDSPNKPR